MYWCHKYSLINILLELMIVTKKRILWNKVSTGKLCNDEGVTFKDIFSRISEFFLKLFVFIFILQLAFYGSAKRTSRQFK